MDEKDEAVVVTKEDILASERKRRTDYTPIESIEELQKSVDGSTQSQSEIRESHVVNADLGFIFGDTQVQEPPFDPYAMMGLLTKDPTHFRAVTTKVTDSVGRGLEFKPAQPLANKSDLDEDCDAPVGVIAEEDYNAELSEVLCFIEDANPDDGFQAVLENAAKDYESIGWCAIEVIRGADMKIKHLAHVPAPRVRVLRGKVGFVEILDDSTDSYRYYMPFGTKVVTEQVNPITDERVLKPYSPADGELSMENADLRWNLVGQEDGKPLTFSSESLGQFIDAFSKSANEILYLQKYHPASIYYGFPDVTPAITSIMEKIHISNWSLNFFENYTIPRWAIIVEGGQLGPDTKEVIKKYFETSIKSNSHAIPVLEVPQGRGSKPVKIRFERLDADSKESDYLETKKNRSAEIREAHGIPPAVSGVSEQSELGSGKGLSQAEIYKDRIVSPLQKIWARSINLLFQRGLGINKVKAFFSPLDIRDKFMEMNILTGYVDRGIYTLNEARNQIEEIQGRIEGGDRAFIRAKEGGIVFVDDFNEMSSSMPGGNDNPPENKGLSNESLSQQLPEVD